MKNQKGITLVALIITIVVMLILVAVAITTAINSNVIDSAKNATSSWEAEQTKESNLNGVTINNKTIEQYP